MGNDPSYFSSCGDDCPVDSISWWDGVAYLNALSQAAGLSRCYTVSGCTGTPGSIGYSCTSVTFAGLSCSGYRYPTESEWEYAARAGTTTAFHNGAITQGNCSRLEPALWAAGWYCGNANSTTHPVGTKQANAFGLYDMHGNVSEWVHDWYAAYGTTTVVDSVGAQSGTQRTFRGGSTDSPPHYCRSAVRQRIEPFYRDNNLGLRPARTGP